jgi:vacuolar protein sorting-associated protein 45
VIVFIIGGVTYEEALTVHEMNTNDPKLHIVLGGTYIHNSKRWIDLFVSLLTVKSFLEDVVQIKHLTRF